MCALSNEQWMFLTGVALAREGWTTLLIPNENGWEAQAIVHPVGGVDAVLGQHQHVLLRWCATREEAVIKAEAWRPEVFEPCPCPTAPFEGGAT